MAKFLGKVCARHPELNGERYSGGRKCVACQNKRTQYWYKNNKEKHAKLTALTHKRKTKQWRKDNKEQWAKVRHDFYQRNKKKIKEKRRIYRLRNLPLVLEQERNGRIRNSATRLANCRQSWIRRYALIGDQKISRTHSKEIKRIYRECPDGHEVDHIIPLRGEGVNGLHVPWNLQYLPAIENRKKGNRVEGV